jgi:hypothetical protein
MNYLIISPFLIFFALFPIQDVKMNGKYKMEYDYSYGSQNGIIEFNKDTYTRKQLKGKKIKGTVDYQKYFIFLNDKGSHLQVKFPKREIGNDTIFFRTTDLNSKSDKEMGLTVYAGKLIRIK